MRTFKINTLLLKVWNNYDIWLFVNTKSNVIGMSNYYKYENVLTNGIWKSLDPKMIFYLRRRIISVPYIGGIRK